MSARNERMPCGRDIAAASDADGIDFVLTWVDETDPAWRSSRDSWLEREVGPQAEDASDERFRDMGTLRHWFRGVERFAPWVRRVHFVTCGHVPSWLNLDHPKLHVVRHDEFMPADALPTFNSNAIELCMDAIPGLAERFVSFNDDMFLVGGVRPDDFFSGGLPRDMLALQPVIANVGNPVMSYIYLNNSLLLARHFSKRGLMRRHPGWFFHAGYPARYFAYNAVELAFPQITGFYSTHGPAPLLRRTFSQVRDVEGEALAGTARHRFRDARDVSIYALREWQKLSGAFVPANVTRSLGYYALERDGDLDRLDRGLRGKRPKVACVNDGPCADFDARAARVRALLDRVLGAPCSFERDRAQACR